MKTKTLLSILLLIVLASCDPATPQVVELPTVAVLPTLADTATPTLTLTATGTFTETATLDPSVTPTVSATWTPSATITDTPSPTPTRTPVPTAEPRPVNDLISIAQQATIVTLDPTQIVFQSTMIAATIIASGGTPAPGGGTPIIGGTPGTAVATPSNCSFTPMGGFATVYNSNPTLQSQLGCAINMAVTYGSALQTFERGMMLWVQGPPMSIYLLYPDGSYRRLDDTYIEGVDPISGGETPPSGFLEPVRGFGKVWRTYQDVRAAFGWATANESGGQSSAQPFNRGLMISLPQQGQILVFVDDGSGIVGRWSAVAGSF
jgi:hypothetical protein